MFPLLLPAAALLLGLPTAANAEQCVFEPSYFSREKYEVRTFVEWVRWGEDGRAGILMRNGDAISIQHYACEHLGLSATMVVRPPSADADAARQKILELAAVVLETGEREELETDLAAHPLAFDTPRDIAGGPESRPEFSYTVRRMGDYDLVELRYYYN